MRVCKTTENVYVETALGIDTKAIPNRYRDLTEAFVAAVRGGFWVLGMVYDHTPFGFLDVLSSYFGCLRKKDGDERSKKRGETNDNANEEKNDNADENANDTKKKLELNEQYERSRTT
jgi:hypothetical protein